MILCIYVNQQSDYTKVYIAKKSPTPINIRIFTLLKKVAVSIFVRPQWRENKNTHQVWPHYTDDFGKCQRVLHHYISVIQTK